MHAQRGFGLRTSRVKTLHHTGHQCSHHIVRELFELANRRRLRQLLDLRCGPFFPPLQRLRTFTHSDLRVENVVVGRDEHLVEGFEQRRHLLLGALCVENDARGHSMRMLVGLH